MADASTRDTTGSLWHRPSFLASAVAVVLLLAIAIAVIVSNVVGDHNTSTAPAPAPPTATVPLTTPTPAFSASVCGLGGVEASGSVSRAPDATWSLVGTTAAPAVAGSGPGVIEDSGLRYCFAHTATGSVVAAANFVALGSTQAIFADVVDHCVAKGPGKESLAAQGPASDGGVRIQVMGFRLLSYDNGKTATVDLALRTSRGALAGQVYDLVWEDGDWKMRVSDQGELLTQIVQLPDLTGYIPWSGA